MSLYGYKKKTKPALWTEVFQEKKPELARTWPKVVAPWSRQFWKAVEKVVNRRAKPRTPKQKHSSVDRAAYRKRVKEWLLENLYCQACQPIAVFCGVALHADGYQKRRSTQCHHKHGRRGALLLYEPLWLPVCGPCHDWIHKHVEAARQLGLYAPAGQWERMPP